MFEAAARERPMSAADRPSFDEIIHALRLTSLCGFGTGLAEFAESIARHYSQELRSCFR